MYKNTNAQHSHRKRKAMIRSSESLSKCLTKQTSIIFEKSEPESCGKLCDAMSSKIKICNETFTTETPCVDYKMLKSKPQQVEMQEFSGERVISKVSLGKTRAKDELYDSEITLLGLKKAKSSTRTRKHSSILKAKHSDMRIPSRHKSDPKRKYPLSAFYPRSLEVPKEKADVYQSEIKKIIKAKTPKSSRTKVGKRPLIHKFYPEDKKPVVLPIQRSVSCNLEIYARLEKTKARLQEIYDKYSDSKSRIERKSKTLILDECSSAHELPFQKSRLVCTSRESYADPSKNYKMKPSSSQKQFSAAPSTIQNSYHQTFVTEDMQPCGSGAQTKYLEIYSRNVEMPTASKFIDNKMSSHNTMKSRAAKSHSICSSKHSLKTEKYKDGITDSFHHDENIDINCRYKGRSTTNSKHRTVFAKKQETPVYSNKSLYRKYDTGGSDYYQTTSQYRRNYLLEKPSYRQLSKNEDYYKIETSVTNFQNKNKKPLKYLDMMDEYISGNHTKYMKNKPIRSSSKKPKKKIQFESHGTKPYGYELPDSNKYPKQDRDYSLPEKDNMHIFMTDGSTNFCTICDSNFERKYNATSPSPSYKVPDERSKANVNYTTKNWEQMTTLDQKDSNYYKDKFTRNRETSYQVLDRIHKQSSSKYRTDRDQVYPRHSIQDSYKIRTVIKQEPPNMTVVKESYLKTPLDLYSQADTATLISQVSASSARKVGASNFIFLNQNTLLWPDLKTKTSLLNSTKTFYQ